MKKNYFIKSLLSLLVIIAVSMMVSCDKDDNPVKKEEKNPSEPTSGIVKAVLTMHDGHLHGVYGFHQNTHAKEVKYLAVNQKFVYHLKEGKWVADAANPKCLAAIAGPTVYALVIEYYDQDGKIVNADYIDNDADKRFKHYFMPRDVKAGFGNEDYYTYDNDVTELFGYVYCDTNPWNKSNKFDGAEFVGSYNPIGFKGYLKFETRRVTFNLAIKLTETSTPKGEDSADNYYNPDEKLLAESEKYPEIILPVNVFMGSGEIINDFKPELGKAETDYSAKERSIIQSLANACGITFQEAATDFFFQLNGEAGHNDKGFWF